MKNNFFIDYFKEVENADCIDTDYGFILYRICNRECYICHAYITPSFRGRGYGKQLLARVMEIAAKNECLEVSCNIFKKDNGAELNRQKYLSQGFEIINENKHVITMSREL